MQGDKPKLAKEFQDNSYLSDDLKSPEGKN